jgi:hypothetical protein
MIDTIGIEQGAASLHSVHLITFAQKQFSQICTILPGNSGNKSSFLHGEKFNLQI